MGGGVRDWERRGRERGGGEGEIFRVMGKDGVGRACEWGGEGEELGKGEIDRGMGWKEGEI